MASLMDDEEIKKALTPSDSTDGASSLPGHAQNPPVNPSIASYLMDKYPEKFQDIANQKQAALQSFDTQNPAQQSPIKRLLMTLGSTVGDQSYGDLAKQDLARRAAQREAVAQPFEQQQADLTGQAKAVETGQGIQQGQIDLNKAQAQAKVAQDSADPNSDFSKRTQASFAATFPSMANSVKGMSANEVEQKFPWAKEAMENARKTEQNKNEALMARAKLTQAQTERDYTHGLNEQKQDTQWSNEFTKATQSNKEALDAISQAGGLLKNAAAGNQQAQNQLGVLLQKAATGSKRAGGATAAQFADPTSGLGQLEHKASLLLEGKLPASDIDNIAQNLVTLKQMNENSLRNQGESFAKRRSASNGQDLATNYKRITGDDYQGKIDTTGMAQTDQDQQAISWAKANPGDPRSKKILGLHGL